MCARRCGRCWSSSVGTCRWCMPVGWWAWCRCTTWPAASCGRRQRTLMPLGWSRRPCPSWYGMAALGRGRSAAEQPAAIDVVDLAVDVGGFGRGQVADRGGDLLGAARATGRYLADATLASLGGEAATEELGALDEPWRDRVDRDPLRAKLQRQPVGQADHAGLGRRVDAAPAAERRDRADVDDAPARAPQVRAHGPCHQEAALQVRADNLVPDPLGPLQRCAVVDAAGTAGVVDQHVDGGTDLGGHPVEGCLHLLAAAHVSLPPADP